MCTGTTEGCRPRTYVALIVSMIAVLLVWFMARCAAADDLLPLTDPLVAKVYEHIDKVNPRLPQAEKEYGAQFITTWTLAKGLPVWRIVYLAEAETNFDIINNDGDAGERGYLQVHPCHFDSMRKCGLNPDNYEHCFKWGLSMIEIGLDEHNGNWWRALGPWRNTRAFAINHK